MKFVEHLMFFLKAFFKLKTFSIISYYQTDPKSYIKVDYSLYAHIIFLVE